MTGVIAENITFGYEPGRLLFDRWSASFEGGQTTAITGPSGRGKSTMLYLLGLMLQPEAGSRVILETGDSPSGSQVPGNALDLSDATKSRLRASTFGFVFQDAALDPTRTVIDNVTETALYAGVDRQSMRTRAFSLLQEFGVQLRSDAKPGQVSGGQAQRIALARALLLDPAIVLADEPTGNLDPASAQTVLSAFRSQAQRGSTVIIVTHDPRTIDSCDRVISI